MSEFEVPQNSPRRRRSDAQRSIAAILDAATRVLDERPEASVEDIAQAAGVTRQTVYAHYASRDALLSAVIDHVTAATVAALDAAELEKGPPARALVRLVNVSWQTLERYPFLGQLAPMSPQESHDRHLPIVERFEHLIRRGQLAGDFDRQLTPSWLVAALIGLAHTAGQEVAAGRMTTDEALDALRESIMRVFGVDSRRGRRDASPAGSH
jgi:AcrR family transcriptional regulator